MEKGERKLYYAIVWNTDLEEDKEIKGAELTKDSELPEGELFLYGSNDNDVVVIRKNVVKSKYTYDYLTTKQTLEYYVEERKYIMKRDVRVIVWEGKEKVSTYDDYYRIVTPEMFYNIARSMEDADKEPLNVLPKRILDVFNMKNVSYGV